MSEVSTFRLYPVIGAVLRYDHPRGDEVRELQETIRAEGERSALARYAGIDGITRSWTSTSRAPGRPCGPGRRASRALALE